MPTRRPNPDTLASRRREVEGMLRRMPTRWRRAYNTARRTLVANGGPVLPDVPTPEQAMLILANTAGGNRDIDRPTGDERVPQAVRDEAMHGLRLSYARDYPGWEFFGIARAIQLVLSPGVPMRTRQRMKRYLDAHAKDKLAPHFGDEARPSKGYMAWLNWGGDAGAAWNEDVPRATYSSRTRGEGARRNGVSEAHKAEKPEAVVMDPKRMARVFVENPRVRRNPARNPARRETYLEGVERRSAKKGKAERALGTAQMAHGGVVLGTAAAKRVAPKAAAKVGARVAAKVGAKVGARAIPFVGEALMVVGAGKEAYKVGKRRIRGGGGSWKTDIAKVGAGAVGIEDFVPDAEERPKRRGAKKNPAREARGAGTARGTVYFDMDETLLHTSLGKVRGLPSFKLDGFVTYSVAVRPDAKAALAEAAKHATVNVLTTADRQYALKALDLAGLLGPDSPIRKVYSTREPEDVPPAHGPWVLLDNDPDSAAEKTQVLVGYDAFPAVTIVPDFENRPHNAPDALLRGVKKALRTLHARK